MQIFQELEKKRACMIIIDLKVQLFVVLAVQNMCFVIPDLVLDNFKSVAINEGYLEEY